VNVQGDLQNRVRGDEEDAVVELAALRRRWGLKAGEPFRQASWNEAKNLTIAQLRAEGYPAATWVSTTAKVDAQNNTVTLSVLADSGPLFHMGPITIEGLQRYTEEDVRRLSTFHPGDPYSEQLLLDYQDRLVKVGLFEGAVIEIDPNPDKAAAAPVLIRVKELPLQAATVGVGYSANTGPRVSLEHWHRRILGQRWILHDKTELGPDLKSIGADLTSWPLANLYRDLVSANYERLRAADELRTSWNTRVGRTQDNGRIERTYYLEATHARVDAPALVTSSDALSANYHWVLRRVDDVLLPTRGYGVNAQGAVGWGKGRQTQPLLMQETDARGPFARAYVRLTGYKPLGDWYASARLEAGQVFAASRIAVPDPILFRAGGDDSVRGYGYRTLGPVIDGAVASGRVLATGSFEIARPVSSKLPSVWGAAFVDAGNAADRWQDLHAVLGYGVGVRWRSPVGPLKIDLSKGAGIDHLHLDLSIGVIF